MGRMLIVYEMIDQVQKKIYIHVIYISEEIVLEINYTLDLKFPFTRKNILMIFYQPDDCLNMILILIWFKQTIIVKYFILFYDKKINCVWDV